MARVFLAMKVAGCNLLHLPMLLWKSLLKIIMVVLGSLKIDSAKVTSWDPEINNYTKFKLDVKPYPINYSTKEIDKVPRPYIVAEDATGTINITRSELAYLG